MQVLENADRTAVTTDLGMAHLSNRALTFIGIVGLLWAIALLPVFNLLRHGSMSGPARRVEP